MPGTKLLKLMEDTESKQEFTPSYVKEEEVSLIDKVGEFNTDSLLPEEGGSDVLSIYQRQIGCHSFLSAEEEKNLSREIKQREREIVNAIAHLFEILQNRFTRRGTMTVSKEDPGDVGAIANSSGKGNFNHRGILFQFLRINELMREMKRIKSLLSGSEEKAPHLDVWREAKEKGDAEISKLIAHIKLDREKIEKVITQLKAEIPARMGTDQWNDERKTLEGLFHLISLNLQLIKREKNTLVKSHLILVPQVAKRYCNRGMDHLDLIQEGNRGLMRAVDTFDYRKGTRFISYAIWWVRQSMIRAIHNQSRTVRIPVYLFDRLSNFLNASERVSQKEGREPTLGEIAKEMRAGRSEAMEISSIFKTTVSWEDFTQGETEGARNNGKKGSIVGMTIHADLKRKLKAVLAHLSPREEEIMRLRYGVDGDCDEQSLQEIGQKFNLSRERIRQIERSALTKLRKMRTIHELREFLN